MRQYIRHPSSMPIEFDVSNSERHIEHHRETLTDVSNGGLSFYSSDKIDPGKMVHVRIDVKPPPFDANGIVIWCHKSGDGYRIGLRFNDDEVAYSLRMIEQICHIEHYRGEVLRNEDRKLTSEEAAVEWIDKFAASFPH